MFQKSAQLPTELGIVADASLALGRLHLAARGKKHRNRGALCQEIALARKPLQPTGMNTGHRPISLPRLQRPSWPTSISCIARRDCGAFCRERQMQAPPTPTGISYDSKLAGNCARFLKHRVNVESLVGGIEKVYRGPMSLSLLPPFACRSQESNQPCGIVRWRWESPKTLSSPGARMSSRKQPCPSRCERQDLQRVGRSASSVVARADRTPRRRRLPGVQLLQAHQHLCCDGGIMVERIVVCGYLMESVNRQIGEKMSWVRLQHGPGGLSAQGGTPVP